MTEQTDDPTLRILRRIDAKVDRIAEDVHDMKLRLTGIEEGLAGINRRIDRLEVRIDRIERRLDLVHLPH